jgi:hypothetical protein
VRHQYSVRKIAAAVITIRFAVACAMTGVIRRRLKRTVTWRGALFEAGFTALHVPVAAAGYSPPGAFIKGEASTMAGGCGSVT